MHCSIQPTSFKKSIPSLFYLIVGLGGFITIRLVPNLLDMVPPCLFKTIFHIPCPACGATRCGYNLVYFHFLDALLNNPFFFFVYIGIAMWGIHGLAGLLFKKRIDISLTDREHRMMRWTIIIAFPASWLVLVFLYQITGRNG